MMSWLQFAVSAPAIFILGMCASVFIVARAMRSGRLVFLDDVAFMRMQQRCVEIKIAPGMFVRACVNVQLDFADNTRAQMAAQQKAESGAKIPDEAPEPEAPAPSEAQAPTPEAA